MDSLYVRFKFGMPALEFCKLADNHPQLQELVFGGAIHTRHLNHLYIKDRHKFLDWARNSGLYDEKSLDDLEWLICQEMMKELA